MINTNLVDLDAIRQVNQEMIELIEQLAHLRDKRNRIALESSGIWYSDSQSPHYKNYAAEKEHLRNSLLEANVPFEDIALVFNDCIYTDGERLAELRWQLKASGLHYLPTLDKQNRIKYAAWRQIQKFWQDHDIYTLEQALNVPYDEYHAGVRLIGVVTISRLQYFLRQALGQS